MGDSVQLDLGNLMVCAQGSSSADADRECIQSLFVSLGNLGEKSSTKITLPSPLLRLPSEGLKKIKEKTKWEQFAEEKGIAPKGKRERRVYNKEKNKWLPRYGLGSERHEKRKHKDWCILEKDHGANE